MQSVRTATRERVGEQDSMGGGVVWVWWGGGAGSWVAIEPPSASALFTPQGEKRNFISKMYFF
jgi:hypothetical protein